MTPLSYIRENQYWTACNGSQDLHKERTACRYYQTGNCRRGSNCPFAHVSVAIPLESPTISHPMYSGESMYSYYPLTQSPVYLPLSTPTQPVFLWQPYPPLSPSHGPRYGLVCQTENLPDYPDDQSDPSSAESSSTATSMDRRFCTALDTAWSEPLDLGTLRGVAGLPGDVGTNLSSPRYRGYSHPVFAGVQTDSVVSGGDHATSGTSLDQGSMVTMTSPFSPTWQDDSKKKLFAYKTKPCKFYVANGQCTSGDKCTFIHDPESQGNPKRYSPTLTLPTEAKLPPKPVDKYDECRARDYYPITWRVIGGGVMMGGKRKICPAFVTGQCKLGDDCKLAHETELETDEVGYIEPRTEPHRRTTTSPQQPQQGAKGTMPKLDRSAPRGRGKVQAETPRPVVPPLATPRPSRPPLPVAGGSGTSRKKGGQVALSAPASPVHRRTQSMTMVVSPSVSAHASYAAEL